MDPVITTLTKASRLLCGGIPPSSHVAANYIASGHCGLLLVSFRMRVAAWVTDRMLVTSAGGCSGV